MSLIIKRNYKFKDFIAFRISGLEGSYIFEDMKLEKNDGKIVVPYIFFSQNYKKYYEDNSYWDIKELEEIAESIPKKYKNEFVKALNFLKYNLNKSEEVL